MTTHHILAHFQPKTKRLHRPRAIKDYTYDDPYRRLLAAVAVLALTDLIWPSAFVEPDDVTSAYHFVTGERDIYLYLGIPIERYNALLEAINA